jgi:putative transposase
LAGTTCTLYIEPGSPWENAYRESFNTRLRGVLLEEHRAEHNDVRPHRAHDYETPNAFFEGWLTRKKDQAVETVYNPGLS